MFPAEKAWMINPHSSTTRRRKPRRSKKGKHIMAKRKRSRSRKGKMPAGLKAYWAKKRAGSNPPKKRRKSSKRRSVSIVQVNSPKRKRRSHRSNAPRRRHRRNPGTSTFKGLIPSSGFVMEAAFVTGGFFLTRMTTGYVTPFLGTFADQPLARIGVKAGVALGLGFLGGKFMGAKNGQLIMLGGLVEVLSDAVKTYVSPFVPALGEEVGSYPMISSYPMGDAYSNPYSVGVDEFDEV